MKPTHLNIELEEGTDQTVTLLFTDETTNLPIDLTGYSANLRVLSKFGSPHPLLYITNLSSAASSHITLGGATGKVDINFKNLTVDLFESGEYDIFLRDTVGIKTKLAKGFILLNRSSTSNPI